LSPGDSFLSLGGRFLRPGGSLFEFRGLLFAPGGLKWPRRGSPSRITAPAWAQKVLRRLPGGPSGHLLGPFLGDVGSCFGILGHFLYIVCGDAFLSRSGANFSSFWTGFWVDFGTLVGSYWHFFLKADFSKIVVLL